MVSRITTNPEFVIGLPAVLFASLHLTNVDEVVGVRSRSCTTS